MASYTRESYDDFHESKDHQCGTTFKYVVHKLEEPVLEYSSPDVSGEIRYNPDADTFFVSGQFRNVTNQTMRYWAANPIFRNYSYAGSALPYPTPEVAYENTPNQGDILLDNEGKFAFTLSHPSGYYVRLGKILMKPHVHFKVKGIDVVYTLTLSDSFPDRSLKNLPDRPNRSAQR